MFATQVHSPTLSILYVSMYVYMYACLYVGISVQTTQSLKNRCYIVKPCHIINVQFLVTCCDDHLIIMIKFYFTKLSLFLTPYFIPGVLYCTNIFKYLINFSVSIIRISFGAVIPPHGQRQVLNKTLTKEFLVWKGCSLFIKSL